MFDLYDACDFAVAEDLSDGGDALEGRRPSLLQGRRPSPRPASTTPIGCAWCDVQLSATQEHQRFCSRRCRQAAWRIRQLHEASTTPGKPLRMAYADPPYPGFARKLYKNEPTYAGEVDHAALIASLTAVYDGWALSTSAKALAQLLPLCPKNTRVCVWAKQHAASPLTWGVHNCWEPVLVVPGRRLRPGRRDWLMAYPARGGGKRPGRKPLAFCAWLFSLLGLCCGDTLEDLFPGTGIVGRAWRELSRAPGLSADSDGVVRGPRSPDDGPGLGRRPGPSDGA